MKPQIQIGDKVRFLNAQGGGVVKRIQKNIAWVQGEDGFELPTPIAECVVVGDHDSFAPAYQTPGEIRKKKEAASSPKSEVQVSVAPSPKKASENRPPREIFIDRPEGDKIDLHIAFLPVSFDRFADGVYEMYLINESNYDIDYYYATQSVGGRLFLRQRGTIAPDTQEFVDEISIAELNKTSSFAFQAMAYKSHKTFEMQKPISLTHPLESRDFIKRHRFVPNPFFDEDALVFPLMLQGKSIMEVQKFESKKSVESALQQMQEEKQTDRDVKPKKLQSQPHATSKIEEVDLHIEALLETSSGMTPHEKLLYQQKVFVKEMKQRSSQKGSRVVFIHGKGQGVLRQFIIQTIEKEYPKVSYRDASFKEYGFGALEVTFH